MSESPRLFFEDLDVGFRHGGLDYRVERDEMIAFAQKWDPRDIHLDQDAAIRAGFDDVIASGAYTTAIFTLLSMRSRHTGPRHAIIAGLGAEMRLPRPVYAGSLLTFHAEVADKRASRSKPGRGIIETRAWLETADGQRVYESDTTTLFAMRSHAS